MANSCFIQCFYLNNASATHEDFHFKNTEWHWMIWRSGSCKGRRKAMGILQQPPSVLISDLRPHTPSLTFFSTSLLSDLANLHGTGSTQHILYLPWEVAPAKPKHPPGPPSSEDHSPGRRSHRRVKRWVLLHVQRSHLLTSVSMLGRRDYFFCSIDT